MNAFTPKDDLPHDQDGIDHRSDPHEHNVGQGLGASVQHIWLAGLGALGRVQTHGGKLFDSLVREGAKVQSDKGPKLRESAEKMRMQVESQVDETSASVRRGWERFSSSVDERIHSVLRALHIPTAEDIHRLEQQIAHLQAELQAMKSAQQATKEET